ncbi:MAG: carboxypeptidase regulatory-like domain-containing protein, partial [Acidobacteria bacterium]|nr:carboxypeptidase regulatory-like domain-containing protein [Acidobacteriota bacterium]
MRVAVLAALLVAFSATATEIVTTSNAQTSTATLHAHRIDAKAEPIERSIVVPGTSSVDLPDGVWEIRIDGAALWGPRIYARATDSVVLPLWAAGVLRGTLKNAPKALAVQFSAVDAIGPSGEADCSIDGQAWACTMPVGRHDLRFSNAGFAPEYRFGVSVPGVQQAPIQFTAGASLSGRVEAIRGVKVPLDELQIRMTSTGGKAQQHYTTTANAKGFFQLKGLAPGDYTITAVRSGLVAQRRGVAIKSGMAAQLNAPLLLDRPKRLGVAILPMLDPEMRPWIVALHAYGPDHRQSNLLTQSAATTGGEWTAPALLAGDYAVQISRADGQTWKWQDVAIGDADVELPLAVLGERLTGTITLGERPLAAKLSFGDEHGSALVSDDTGHFEGEIPPGDSDERTVFIESQSAQIVRTVRVKLERTESGKRAVIRLADTTLFGRVTREDGSPAPDAIVTIDASGNVQQVIAQADGTFQLQGAGAGRVPRARGNRLGQERTDAYPARERGSDRVEPRRPRATRSSGTRPRERRAGHRRLRLCDARRVLGALHAARDDGRWRRIRPAAPAAYDDLRPGAGPLGVRHGADQDPGATERDASDRGDADRRHAHRRCVGAGRCARAPRRRPVLAGLVGELARLRRKRRFLADRRASPGARRLHNLLV